MIKEEILSRLREKNNIIEGSYISFFKRIGNNKSVSKIMNFKPDYFIQHEDNSFDCLFFIEKPFEAFNHLSKLAVLKMLSCEFDFRSIIFYSKNYKLIEYEERGLISEKKNINALDSIDYINKLIAEFEQKIGKKIILNIE